MDKAPCDTVAIVDDDEAVRHSLQLWLQAVGHKVETFASVAEFLKAEVGKLLCLIVDHHTSGMSGLELAEQLRAEGNTIPIMLTTGLPSRAIYARAAEVGVDEVLEKPFDEALLLTFIDTAKR